jgi:hypothetical protein
VILTLLVIRNTDIWVHLCVLVVILTGWYGTKRLTHCGYFLLYYASESEFWSLHIQPPEISDSNQQRQLVTKQEKLGKTCLLILQAKYLCHTPQGSLTCRKLERHGADSFTSPPKEVVLRILSPLKIHRPRPGLNPRNFGPMASKITSRPETMTVS